MKPKNHSPRNLVSSFDEGEALDTQLLHSEDKEPSSNTKDGSDNSLSNKKVQLDMCDCDKECYWPEDVKEAVQNVLDKIIEETLRKNQGRSMYFLELNGQECIDIIKEEFGESLQ